MRKKQALGDHPQHAHGDLSLAWLPCAAPLDASLQPQPLAVPGSQGRSTTLCSIPSCEGLWAEYTFRLQYFQLTMHLPKGNPITHQEALALAAVKPQPLHCSHSQLSLPAGAPYLLLSFALPQLPLTLQSPVS